LSAGHQLNHGACPGRNLQIAEVDRILDCRGILTRTRTVRIYGTSELNRNSGTRAWYTHQPSDLAERALATALGRVAFRRRLGGLCISMSHRPSQRYQTVNASKTNAFHENELPGCADRAALEKSENRVYLWPDTISAYAQILRSSPPAKT
jgi:hypothetical protein